MWLTNHNKNVCVISLGDWLLTAGMPVSSVWIGWRPSLIPITQSTPSILIFPYVLLSVWMAIIHLSFHCLAVSNRYCIVSFGVCFWVWLVSHSHLGCTDNHNHHEGDWAVVSQCTTHGQVSILQMCPYIWPHLTYTEMWRFSVRLVMANVWRISWFPGLWLVNHSNSWLRLVLNWRVGPIFCQSEPCFDYILYWRI